MHVISGIWYQQRNLLEHLPVNPEPQPRGPRCSPPFRPKHARAPSTRSCGTGPLSEARGPHLSTAMWHPPTQCQVGACTRSSGRLPRRYATGPALVG